MSITQASLPRHGGWNKLPGMSAPVHDPDRGDSMIVEAIATLARGPGPQAVTPE